MAHGLSCSAVCGVFPDQGLNSCLLHWQVDSLPLSHQVSPGEIVVISLSTNEETDESERLMSERYQNWDSNSAFEAVVHSSKSYCFQKSWALESYKHGFKFWLYSLLVKQSC